MSNQFKDDKMEYIENDIEKIQMKTGMYISYVGEKGALHLCKEIIQNAIDECANKNSPAKNIHITLDLLEDKITVEDDGRGIPEDDFPMEILCTRLNSGSKFTREQGGASSGENGVGLMLAHCFLSAGNF
jgi:DNA gyrase/topoisomerase IV subunit B